MKLTTSQPTAWFALGVFAGWAAAWSVSTIAGGAPDRWDSEAGLFVGHILSLLIAAVIAAPYGVWFAWRGRPILRLPFLLPLVFGMLHPWVSVALTLGISWLGGQHPAAMVAALLVLFGSPLALGELTVRLSAPAAA